MTFAFHTDERSRKFCESIVRAMELRYDIAPTVGCELLNEMWRGKDWRDPSNGGTSEYAWLLYHETERDWAKRIGNPHPYTDEGIELTRYKVREDEAQCRLKEFRSAGLHDWLI